jgi:hypothetical protein
MDAVTRSALDGLEREGWWRTLVGLSVGHWLRVVAADPGVLVGEAEVTVQRRLERNVFALVGQGSVWPFVGEPSDAAFRLAVSGGWSQCMASGVFAVDWELSSVRLSGS